MAQRYGGKFSPGTASHPRNPDGMRRSRVGARVNFLFIAPVPMLLVAFQMEPTGLFLKFVAFGIMMLAAWLTKEGLVAEDAYHARRVAKKPAIPRKIFGSVLTGIGLALAGLNPETFSLLNPALYFILGTVLHFIAFGPDPLQDKGTEGMNEYQTDRVARVVDEAERHLAAMKDAIRRAQVPALERRVSDFVETARGMFRVVEEDPRDLTSARKFLGVYLLGARDATVQFADLYARSQNHEARADYEALLDDLESSFAQKTEKLLLDDKSSLDVEIEVLRDRLEREGVRSEI
ncbi:MAG: 5-bromo-4-chloroindolyl phosphate hydrolysis family protein [Pseudomonadota bacterium]